MNNTKTFSIPSLHIKTKIMVLIALLAIGTIVPSIIHSQFITGPIVNATLFIAAVLVGPFEAVLVGLIPSTVAMTSGLLPLPLAPMVPFIMLGNAIMIGAFHYTKSKSFVGAVIFASVLKFAFLYSVVTLLMNTMLQQALVTKLSIMMSWPQLVTALIGGAIAFVILKKMKKCELKSNYKN